MQIFILGAVLIGLAALLALIILRTTAMIREQRPLLAIGPVQWHAKTRQVAAVADPPSPGAPSATTGFGRAAAFEETLPSTPEIGPARGRTRKLISISELALAESDEPAVEAGYCNRVEQRLEFAFEALCEGTIDLEAYSVIVQEQHADALRLQRQLGPLADEGLFAEVTHAIAALEWCRDWARKQMGS